MNRSTKNGNIQGLSVAALFTLTLTIGGQGCSFRPLPTTSQIKTDSVAEPNRFSHDIVTFNWSNSTESFSRMITASIGRARQLNRSIKSTHDIPDMAAMGYGLYIATDPLQSSVYGRQLSCVVLKHASTWHSATNDPVKDILNAAAIIRYPFGPGLYSIGMTDGTYHEFAGVIRDVSAISFERSQKISFENEGNGKGLGRERLYRARTHLANHDICGAFGAFENEYETLIYAAHAASPKAIFTVSTFFSPMIGQHLAGSEIKYGAAALTAGRRILRDQSLITRLLAARLIARADELSAAHLISEVVSEAMERSDQDTHSENRYSITNTIQVLNASGLFHLDPATEKWKVIQEAVERDIRQKYEKWATDYPEDTSLMRDLLAELEIVSLRSM